MKKVVCIGFLVAALALAVAGIFKVAPEGKTLFLFLTSLIATAGYTLSVMAFRAAGLTIFNPVDVLGSFFGNEPTRKTKVIGSILHYLMGFILALDGKLLLSLAGLELTVVTGLIWGAVASMGALIFFTTIDSIHPRMQKDLTPAPGPLALSYGRATPWVIILGHLIFGAILGEA